MTSDLEELLVYKKFKMREWSKLDKAWAMMAIRYKKIRKRAEKENPPGFNVLLCGVLQALISKDKSFIEKTTQILEGNLPEDTILGLTGMALVDMGYYDEGIERLRKTVELNRTPTNLEALAGNLKNQEDYPEVLELANEMLKHNPNDVDGLRHKIFVLIKYNNFDEAENLAKKALSISPENGLVKEALGEIEYERGNYKEALQWYRKAYSYLDRPPHLWQQLSICYAELGKFRKAKKAAIKMAKVGRSKGDKFSDSDLKAFLNGIGIKS